MDSKDAGRSAFTLIELLVSIGIFVIISSMLLANFRSARNRDAVTAAADVLAAHVEELRAMAVASTGDRDAVAFGVHASTADDDRYIRFGDRASGTRGSYDVGEELPGGVFTLPSAVRIVEVVPAAVTDVSFAIPRATVLFTAGNASGAVRITLAHRTSGDRKTVTINRISGLVSIE